MGGKWSESSVVRRHVPLRQGSYRS
uniref:Nef n=1 Tax=Human immunodeficiency virus type 1 TaxID=11676 RepID=Q73337_HV1|nr:Nef [Human immunodeficiency virus 1]